MTWRIDTFRVDGESTRVSIGIRVPAFIARTGILEYIRADGSIVREYRPVDEVGNQDSLSSWRGAILTDGHHGMLDPTSYRPFHRGHVGDNVAMNEDGIHVGASLYITDADLIAAVESGTRRDISCGYTVDIDESPGEINGQRYDRVQRNIRGNHVALLPPGHGRSGPDVRVRLDSDDNVSIGDEMSAKLEIRIDGTVFDSVDSAQRAVDDLLARCRVAETAVEAARGAEAALQARCDEMEKDLATARSPETLAAAIKERMDLIEKAKKVRSDGRYDGSTRQVMIEALQWETRGDELTDDYIRGAFEAKAALLPQRTTQGDAVRQAAFASPARSRIDELEHLYIIKSRNAWKTNRKGEKS